MNCEQCRELLVDRAEGLLESSAQESLAAHLASCDVCRREAQATDALHQRLVQAGRAHRVANDAYTQAVMDCVARADTGDRSRAFRIRNWLCQSGVLRRSAIAAGLVITVTAALVVLFLSDSAHSSFADVLAQVKKARAVQFHAVVESRTADAQPKTSESDMLLAPPSSMVIRSAGIRIILDLANHTMLTLIEQDKRALLMKLKDIPDNLAHPQENILDLFNKIEGRPSLDLGTRNIDGIQARGYQVIADQMTMAIWADTATELPVLVEVTQPTSKTTFSHFNWNPTVDPAELKTDVPPGYSLMLMNPVTSTAPTSRGP